MSLAIAAVIIGLALLVWSADVLSRDITVMAVLTIALFAVGFGFRGPGRINRYEGALLLTSYIGYTTYLISGVVS